MGEHGLKVVTKRQQVARVLLVALWTLWLGGFSFYSAVVVKIGADVLGSELEQGLITQQVTHSLNALGLAAVVGAAVLAPLSGFHVTRRQAIWGWGLLAVFLADDLFLIYWHDQVARAIDLETRSVEDYDQFYLSHRIYLWVSIGQWLVGWALLVWGVLRLSGNATADAVVAEGSDLSSVAG